MIKIDWLKWKAYRAWYWLPSKLGYWEPKHAFKTCPTGERHCPHMKFHFHAW